MSGATYGGDEVGALVFDIGSHTTKVGYAGEDTPKAVFPTAVGCIRKTKSKSDTTSQKDGDTAMDVDDDKSEEPEFEYIVGSNELSRHRPGMEIRSPLNSDGLVEDWTLMEKLIDYIYNKALCADPKEHPLMISEIAWNTRNRRERLAELLFEKYNVPAIYMCKGPVLTAFASGRSTALVVEGGAASMAVTPVYDGYVLTNGIARSRYGGHALTRVFRDILEKQRKISIVPTFEIQSKSAVSEGEPAKFVRRKLDNTTDSFASHMIDDVVRDFEAHVARVSDRAFHEETLASLPMTMYEFPNGFNESFGVERYQGAEMLFNPKKFGGARPSGSENGTNTSTPASDGEVRVQMSVEGEDGDDSDGEDATMAGVAGVTLGVHELVRKSIHSCDIDIHASLLGQIIVAGGTTLINGFTERLESELNGVLQPQTRFKILSSGLGQKSDRMFAAWVGGSILASLGTFQQLWVSRMEYDQLGKAVMEKKCP
eukprot:m.513680 g.513680  ORF g.513680 m.513680 type:complete len:485 (+) comp21906_c1_seq14:131-1585(+)